MALISMIAPTSDKRIAMIAKEADGVIVGSAIVKQVGEYGKKSVPFVAEYVKMMKKASSERR